MIIKSYPFWFLDFSKLWFNPIRTAQVRDTEFWEQRTQSVGLTSF